MSDYFNNTPFSKYLVAAGVALVAVSLMGFVYHKLEHPTYSFRYRLTIEVEVDGEFKRGSTVVEVRNSTVVFPENAVRHAITGEALWLDLGPGRRPLIALLTKQDQSAAFREGRRYRGWGYEQPEQVLAYAYKEQRGVRESFAEFWPRLLNHRGPVEISAEQLPDLVTFADVNDPKTVLAVDPKDIGTTLGAGVKWKRITIAITDEPITHEIIGQLSWLPDYYDRMLDGHRPGQQGDGSIASRMNTFSFLGGGRK